MESKAAAFAWGMGQVDVLAFHMQTLDFKAVQPIGGGSQLPLHALPLRYRLGHEQQAGAGQALRVFGKGHAARLGQGLGGVQAYGRAQQARAPAAVQLS